MPPDSMAGEELEQQMAAVEGQEHELDETREQLERAKHRLVQEVIAARAELVSEFEAVQQEMAQDHASKPAIAARKKELAEEKAARLADRFLPQERMGIMRRLLKDVHIAGESEARGKFEYLILVGFKMSIGDKNDYAFKLNSKTAGIDDDFDQEEHRLELEFAGLEQAWNEFESESGQE